MSIYKLSLYAGLALLVVGASLLFFDTPRQMLSELDLEQEAEMLPYAVVKRASTRFYDDEGGLSYTFNASQLSHFRPTELAEDSYTSVENPSLVFFEQENPWTINALHGRVEFDQTITLFDSVQLVHRAETGEVTTMDTERLTFYPEQRVARTEEAVTIASPLGEMSAIGMTADVEARTIRLLKNVRGVHRPSTLGQ